MYPFQRGENVVKESWKASSGMLLALLEPDLADGASEDAAPEHVLLLAPGLPRWSLPR